MSRSKAPLLLAFLLVLAATLPPYVIAELRPPRGTSFLGVFYYADDFYNYLSYAQQAQDGAFLFRNKVLLDDHPPAMINLEWWLVGRLAALTGGHLILAYRLFGILATAAFLVVADLWLHRLQVKDAHRLPALLLVATGGGLGSLLFHLTPLPMYRCLDIYAGLFPFLALLANPHFVAGTTLLLWGLLCFESPTPYRGWLVASAVGTALALVRPYDFVLLVLIRGIVVVTTEPARRWLSALAPLGGLLPVVVYLYWLYYSNPAFAFYAQAPYGFPRRSDFLLALGPALLLAAPAAFRFESEAEVKAKVALVAWAGLALLVIIWQPVHFSLQILAGCGFPLLALAAARLKRHRPEVTLLVALAFSTSLVGSVVYLLRPNQLWLTERANMELVAALQHACRPGDLLFAPPEIGILGYGLTPCRAFASHPIAPDYEKRLESLRRFSAGSPEERLAILDHPRTDLLVLPGDAGPGAAAWLGSTGTFARVAVVGRGRWSLYARQAR